MCLAFSLWWVQMTWMYGNCWFMTKYSTKIHSFLACPSLYAQSAFCASWPRSGKVQLPRWAFDCYKASILIPLLAFKSNMESTRLDGKQKSMLQLRFDVLDTYVKGAAVAVSSWFGDGRLVIVDLTDPFVDRKHNNQFIVQPLKVYQVILLRLCSTLFLVYTSVIRPSLASL